MVEKTKTDTTFIKITNKEIYNQIMNNKTLLDKQHSEIIKRLDKTNGRVSKAMVIASTALTIALMSIGFLFQYLNK